MINGQTAALIDDILPNSPDKNVSQSGDIDLGLSYSDLILLYKKDIPTQIPLT